MTPTDTNMNGCTILVQTKDAIYIRLPEGLQRSLGGDDSIPCNCGKCDGRGLMDALVVPTDAKRHATTWMVHMPQKGLFEFRDYCRAKGILVA